MKDSMTDSPWHPFDPTTIDEDAFLLGPERDDGELDIDDIMAKDFTAMIMDMRAVAAFWPHWDRPTTDPTPSDVVPGYSFLEIDHGLLMLAPDGNWGGGFISCDAAILPEHQGQGLGAELFLEYAMRHHGLPTWDLDTPSYSHAGAATARAAWRLAHDRALFQRKAERLMAEQIAPGLGDGIGGGIAQGSGDSKDRWKGYGGSASPGAFPTKP